MKKKYFGTDGIRGEVGVHPITADFMLKLGWAIGRVFADEGHGFVLIGKDTRISGYMFESALESGLSAAGVDIYLLGPIPTPGVAYLTRTLRAKAGIVISASHNIYYDNGIKFFSVDGTKLSDEFEYKIEKYIDSLMTTVASSNLGKVKHATDATGRYIEFCKSTIPINISFSDIRVVIDCAHGATYRVAPCVFSEVGAEVITINTEPNGLNINKKCGTTKPSLLANKVLECRADLGIALDGDGDRLIMVDHKGEIVDGDELIYIIAKSKKEMGDLKGDVIGTLMSNLGMEHALNNLGIKLLRTKVGDRYVMEALVKHQSILGGESSGHIICLDKTTTGDGIIAALQVLLEIHKTRKSLHALKSGMKKYPQILLNVSINKKINPNEVPSIQKAVAIVEKKLANKGRVLLRASGTEPLIRVMVEGENKADIVRYGKYLEDEVKKAV